MKITDLKGCQVKVTDLEKAIKHAGYFKDVYHIPPVESDKERQAYWRNIIYKKFLQLKSKENEQSCR